MIETVLSLLGGWTWWVLGLVLLAVEALAPGLFFIWFGIAAMLIGVSALVVPWPWQWQVLGFAALSVAIALAARHFFGYGAAQPADPTLNRRADRLVGRAFTLAEPLHDGVGRIRVDDTMWRVTGPDLPMGARVRVSAAEGATLHVVPEDPSAGPA
ncbi:hypothetical protein SAMN05216548_11841 [Faunimonas pinastri]|uniref:NfeD-like C-terminal domain-containing protein n=1 Tax=Faunimonas pinastri TaxID=1855383 RepID=A0A1H9P3R7_9HYPH|nr:NfeD family protein [Faunimonas pinastri]SER42555.1 hypothetical protein SAMN05216548_11841 [Faunimonas pinastri]